MRTIREDLVARRLLGENGILELYPIAKTIECPICKAEPNFMCFWPEGDAAKFILHHERLELFYKRRQKP